MARKRKAAGRIKLDAVIGRRIEVLRKQKEIKSVVLAGRVGVSSAQLYSYETGRASCSLYTLTLIAEVLGVPVASLIQK